MNETMYPVYLLRALADPKQTYIGLTDDVRPRLESHNEGANFYTAKYRPWEWVCCISFQSRERAAGFEKYTTRDSAVWHPPVPLIDAIRSVWEASPAPSPPAARPLPSL